MSGFRTYDDWKCTPPADEEEPARAHLWDTLPVRCWCGEFHVLGIDNRDEDSSADDENAPSLDDRLNNDDEAEGCPF